MYAKIEGSAAAPTAGLHFTDETFAKLKEKGVEILDVTLHVGLGTFRPMDTDTIEEHVMHSEVYQMSAETAEALNLAKAEGRRIIAVGTTSVRTLESVWNRFGKKLVAPLYALLLSKAFVFALDAKYKVCMLSSLCLLSLDAVNKRVVFEEPPNESFKIKVSFEFLKGICLHPGVVKDIITIPNVVKLWFIF